MCPHLRVTRRATEVRKREVTAGAGFRKAGLGGVAIPAGAQAAGDRRAGRALAAAARMAGARCLRRRVRAAAAGTAETRRWPSAVLSWGRKVSDLEATQGANEQSQRCAPPDPRAERRAEAGKAGGGADSRRCRRLAAGGVGGGSAGGRRVGGGCRASGVSGARTSHAAPMAGEGTYWVAGRMGRGQS